MILPLSRLLVLACLAGTATGIGILTSNNASMYPQADGITPRGQICKLRDIDSNICLDLWSALPQMLPSNMVVTHMEYFNIDGTDFLAVANYRDADLGSYDIPSVVYRWNATVAEFQYFQSLPSKGALHIKCFTVAQRVYLGIANYISDSGYYSAKPAVYVWQNGRFQPYAEIWMNWAMYIEAFSYNGETYLCIASPADTSTTLTSRVYKWSAINNWFGNAYLSTSSAVQIKSVAVNGLSYLLVNQYPGYSPILYQISDSGLGRGYEVGYSGVSDMQVFAMGGITYLVLTFGNSGNNFKKQPVTVILSWPGAGSQLWAVKQTLFPSSAAAVRAFYFASQWHLVIASYPSPAGVAETNIALYRLSAGSGNFAFLQNVTTVGALSLTYFEVGAHGYLAVAQASPNPSVIYRMGAIFATQMSNSSYTALVFAGNVTSTSCLWDSTGGKLAVPLVKSSYEFGVVSRGMNTRCLNGTLTAASSQAGSCPVSAILRCTIAPQVSGSGSAYLSIASTVSGSANLTDRTGPLTIDSPLYVSVTSVWLTPGLLPTPSSVTFFASAGGMGSWSSFPRTVSLDGNMCTMGWLSNEAVSLTCPYTAAMQAMSLQGQVGGQTFSRNVGPFPAFTPVSVVGQPMWRSTLTISGSILIAQASSFFLLPLQGETNLAGAGICLPSNLVSATTVNCILSTPPLQPSGSFRLWANISLAGTFFMTNLSTTLRFIAPSLPSIPRAPALNPSGGSLLRVTLPSRFTVRDWTDAGVVPPKFWNSVRMFVNGALCLSSTWVGASSALLAVVGPVDGNNAIITVELAGSYNMSGNISGITQPPTLVSISPPAVLQPATPLAIGSSDIALRMLSPADAQRITSIFIGVAKCPIVQISAAQAICSNVVIRPTGVEIARGQLQIFVNWGSQMIAIGNVSLVTKVPELLRVYPAQLPSVGATVVVYGTNLADGALRTLPVVSFGGVPCSNVTFVSSGSWDVLECVSPAVSASYSTFPVVDVKLTNAAGSVALTTLTVTYPDRIDAIWADSVTLVQTLPSSSSSLFGLQPLPKLRVWGRAQLSCVLSLSAITNSSALHSLASLTGQLTGDVQIAVGVGNANLTLDAFGVIAPLGSFVYVQATCRDSFGKSATTPQPLSIWVSPLGLSWDSSATDVLVIPGTLLSVSLTVSPPPFQQEALGVLAQRLFCGVGISVSSLLMDASLQLQQHALTAYAPASVMVSAGTIVVSSPAISTASCEWGQRYGLYASCSWSTSSDVIYAPARQLNMASFSIIMDKLEAMAPGYHPIQFLAVVEVDASIDPSNLQVTCRISQFNSSSSAVRISQATLDGVYVIDSRWMIAPVPQVEVESVEAAVVFWQLSCTCGLQVALGPLVKFVTLPYTIDLAFANGAVNSNSGIFPSGSSPDPWSTVPPITISGFARTSFACTMSVVAYACEVSMFTAGHGLGLTSKEPTLVGGTTAHADVSNATGTTSLLLSELGISSSSGCVIAVQGNCRDGIGRSAVTQPLDIPVPAWAAMWSSSWQIIAVCPLSMAAPQLVITSHVGPSGDTATGVLWDCSMAVFPADQALNVELPLPLQTAIFNEPLDLSTQYSPVLSWRSDGRRIECDGCHLDSTLAVTAECIYASTSERVRLPTQTINVDSLSMTWLPDTASLNNAVQPPAGVPDVVLLLQHSCLRMDSFQHSAVKCTASFDDITRMNSIASSNAELFPVADGLQARFSFAGAVFPVHVNISLNARCTWSTNGQQFDAQSISFSTAQVGFVWTSPQYSLVRTYEPVALSVNFSTNIDPAPSIVDCAVEVAAESPVGASLIDISWATTAVVRVLISAAPASSIALTLKCSVWNQKFVSPPLFLTSSKFRMSLLSTPASFIPSTSAQLLIVEPPVIASLTDDTLLPVTDMSCALLADPGVLLVAKSAPLVNIKPNEQGLLSVPDFGIQASLASDSVTVYLQCLRLAGDVIEYTWNIDAVYMRMEMCALPAASTLSQSILPRYSLGLMRSQNDSCAANNTGGVTARLPAIFCKTSLRNSSSQSVYLAGDVSALDLISRKATFAEFAVTAPQGIDYDFQVACTIGDIIIPPILPFSVRVSGCRAGTEAVGAFCQVCPGDQFSFGGFGVPCKSCPAVGADCSGGVITLLPNFYRASTDTREMGPETQLLPCYNGEACHVNSTSLEYSCATGYTGPLCSVCDELASYARFGDNCRDCWSPFVSFVFLSLLCAAVLVMLGFVAVFNLTQRSDAAAALRVLLSHIGMVGSLRQLQAGGTRTYQDLMSWTEVVAATPLSFGALECALRPSYIVRYVWTVGLPLLATIIVVAYLSTVSVTRVLRARCRRTEQMYQNRESSLHTMSGECSKLQSERRPIATLFFALYITYMPLTALALRSLDCYYPPIDGNVYLRSDMQVECYTPSHNAIRGFSIVILLCVTLAYPLLVFVSLGIPSLQTVRTSSFLKVWGFIAAGYRVQVGAETPAQEARRQRRSTRLSMVALADSMSTTKAAWTQNFKLGHMMWWESVVLVRQAGLLCFGVLLYNPYVQSAATTLWLIAFLAFQIIFRPYRSVSFNLLSTLSVGTAAITAATSTTLLQFYGELGPSMDSASSMSLLEWGVTTVLASSNMLTIFVLVLVWCVLQLPSSVSARFCGSLHRMLKSKRDPMLDVDLKVASAAENPLFAGVKSTRIGMTGGGGAQADSEQATHQF